MQHFDAVVVGSGFGGSVLAYRLAQAGKRVCVLERGKRYRQGDFPRVLQKVHTNFWDPSQKFYGLFNVWFFRRVGALVSSGLGGGSLIYANVMLEKDPGWFADWPMNASDIATHYGEVAKMLTPTKFPYSDVEKVNAFRYAAHRLAERDPNLSVIEPRIAVTFGASRGEPFEKYGIKRKSCSMCGECVVGCNTGAKNTLDVTYLAAAETMTQTPAELWVNHEVKSFAPIDDTTIEVTYAKHDPENQTSTPGTLRTSRLILAAGTFGSTFLMLKNLPNFTTDSKPLGTRFSGNGDLLSFALMCTKPDGEPWRLDATRGPTITTALRHADVLDPGSPTKERGFYIEDAGYPKELAWLAEGFNAGGWFKRGVRFAREFVRKMFGADPDNDLGKELSDLLGPADLSSRMLPLLAMGRDVPDGRFSLDGSRLRLDWTRNASGPYFSRVEDVARDLAGELGGKFLRHPPTYLFGRSVTVHPLGGCPMGRTRDDGVVDSYGQTFIHPALSIIDGSIMPGPVGPNPAFTIAAIANRAADSLT